MTLAELIARREELGMTQKQLAAALGVHPRTVAHWEQGRRAIPAYLDLALQTLERKDDDDR